MNWVIIAIAIPAHENSKKKYRKVASIRLFPLEFKIELYYLQLYGVLKKSMSFDTTLSPHYTAFPSVV